MYRLILIGSVLSIISHVAITASPQHAVAKCCGTQYADCCMESVRFNVPLNCPFMPLRTKIAVVDCIQSEIYGHKQLSVLNFTDTTCCDVFTDNDNDLNGECERVCVSVMQMAGLRTDRKLRKIRGCIKRNPLHRCFLRCVQWNHETDAPFVFEEHCSWRSKMLPGKLYLGDELRL